MFSRLGSILLLCASLFSLTSLPAAADGLIVPDPCPDCPRIPCILDRPCPPIPSPVPFPSVRYHNVRIEVDGQVASVTVEQVFVNESTRPLEGTYIFPLPEDASISAFSMLVDGRAIEGQLLDRNEARRIYEQIVRGRRDPALLEYLGRGAFQARVFPIPPRGESKLEISYTQLLRQDAGLVRLVYPLTTERFSPRPLQQLSIDLTLRADQPIGSAYSPSHQLAIRRPSPQEVRATYEASNARPDRDFEFFYGLEGDVVGADLLTYRRPGEDGFLLLLVNPAQMRDQVVAARDVVLIVDTSGSMAGQKMQQAQAASRFVLNSLNPADQFNLVTFNSDVASYADGLRPASEASQAVEFVNRLRAAGGTNISDALAVGLSQGRGDRPLLVIFVTDGLPTVGLRDAPAILDAVGRVAPEASRIFTFGVGDDVNTVLLDNLAQRYRGVSEYVRPSEDLEVKLSAFYQKVGAPIMTDLALSVDGIRLTDVYPRPLPDLFAGTQLAVLARYSGSGAAPLVLSGQLNDRPLQFTYPGQAFPEQAARNSFIPRLWASRKIGYLLNEVRLRGENKELIDEIVALSLRYGILTPYTSFLVDDRTPLTREGQRQAAEQVGRAAAAAAATPAGAPAVDASQAVQSLRQAENLAAAPANEALRNVAAKTFLLREGNWIDSEFETEMPIRRLVFGSDEYFDLLASNPEWGAYFAVGANLIVVLDGQAYEVRDEG